MRVASGGGHGNRCSCIIGNGGWSELEPVNYSRCSRPLLLLEVRRHLELDDAVVGQTDVEHERHTVARTLSCRSDAGRLGRRRTPLPPLDELTYNLFAKILKIPKTVLKIVNV